MALEVAKTILQQLGGQQFIAMTGAKHFLAGPQTLAFQLPANFARSKINYVRITLDLDDTYSVVFIRARGAHYTVVSQHHTIYADGLQRVFRDQTGLDTSLGVRQPA